jgi:cold shock protein
MTTGRTQSDDVREPGDAAGAEETADVLSRPQFEHEITELLLEEIPCLTAAQLAAARRGLLGLAVKRGWVDS